MRRLFLSTTVLVLSILPAACANSDREPAADVAAASDWDPESADLLFVSYRDGDSEIYTRAGGDTTWVNLTGADTGENWPEWSPDRSHIAFQSDRNGRLDVFVMDSDGSNVTRLTDHEDHDYLPSWTPDGRLLFTSWRQEEGDSARAQHVYVMSADGSGQERLPLAGGAPVVGAQLSPDGQSIVYGTSENDGETGHLHLASTADYEARRITSGDAFHGAPAFSPDGRLLAYYATRESGSDILVQHLETGAVDTVLTGGSHYYPRWSPDGTWMLACSQVEHGDLDVIAFPVDGSRAPVPLVAASPRDCEGRWGPAVHPDPLALARNP